MPTPTDIPPQVNQMMKKGGLSAVLPVIVNFLCIGLFVIFIGFTVMSAVKGAITTATGTLQVTGPTLGTWSAKISGCTSGDAFSPSFNGAQLIFADRPKTHAEIHDRPQEQGDGKSVVVWQDDSDKNTQVILNSSVCNPYQASAEVDVNSQINMVRTASGQVHATCKLPSGDQVQLDADFKNCH